MKKLVCIIGILMLTSCINLSIAPEAIDSIESLHHGNVLQAEDYANLLPLKYKGEDLLKKESLLLKHLELSKEVNDYFQKLKVEKEGKDNE
jgi:hypothetical protein